MATHNMKAWRLHQFGIEHLHLDDIAIPQPGPDELLIKVDAVSINYRDKAIIDGAYTPDIFSKGLLYRLQMPAVLLLVWRACNPLPGR
ncbi:hypothetical protein [Chitinophaga pinensis]|uniref:hypothetical protein n=1 Tax=Chitinophaga pinensis TaxID=79329 RepID=UPI001C9978E5|nr:hypothetical protein [Chitinophaga pinensis]